MFGMRAGQKGVVVWWWWCVKGRVRSSYYYTVPYRFSGAHIIQQFTRVRNWHPLSFADGRQPAAVHVVWLCLANVYRTAGAGTHGECCCCCTDRRTHKHSLDRAVLARARIRVELPWWHVRKPDKFVANDRHAHKGRKPGGGGGGIGRRQTPPASPHAHTQTDVVSPHMRVFARERAQYIVVRLSLLATTPTTTTSPSSCGCVKGSW